MDEIGGECHRIPAIRDCASSARWAIKTPGIRALMTAAGGEAIDTALTLHHRLVPILGKSRIETNDPGQYANSPTEAVLSKWILPDTRVAVLQD